MRTRLLYFGMAHLGLTMTEVGLLRYGLLLDLFECYLQETGRAKPYQEHYIDEVLPFGMN